MRYGPIVLVLCVPPGAAGVPCLGQLELLELLGQLDLGRLVSIILVFLG